MMMNHFGGGICCDGYSGNWWHINTLGRPVWDTEKDEFIWLPRQDQLQEMVDSERYFERPRSLLLSFYNFVDFFNASGTEQYSSQFKTMEQLWLTFVIKEKYNKVWNDGGWRT